MVPFFTPIFSSSGTSTDWKYSIDGAPRTCHRSPFTVSQRHGDSCAVLHKATTYVGPTTKVKVNIF